MIIDLGYLIEYEYMVRVES